MATLLRCALFATLLTVADAESELKLADEALIRGDFDIAVTHYDEAIRLDPKFARPYHGRGVAYFQKQLYDMAIASYSEAARLEPQNDGPVFDRGLAYWEKGQSQKALAEFRAAIRLNAKNDAAHNAAAWAMATAPQAEVRDGKLAITLATRACELTDWKNPYHLSALAAAYAEAGNFPKALDWHRKAMETLPAAKMERARERLKLYEQEKPYREIKGKP